MLPQTKNLKIWKTAFQAVVDFVCLNLGLGLVYLVRFKYFPDLFESSKRLTTTQYLIFNTVFSVMIMVIFALIGVYEINRRKSFSRVLTNLTIGIFSVVFACVSFFFFYEFNVEIFPSGVPVSRFVLLFAGFSALFSVLVGRICFWLIDKSLQSQKIGTIKIAVIGSPQSKLVKHLQSQSHIDQIYIYPTLNLSTVQVLETKMIKHEISEIYVYDHKNNSLEGKLAWLAERYKVNFVFSLEGFGKFEFFDLQPKRINHQLFLEIVHSNIDGWRVVFKRIFDFVFALVFVVIFSPLFLLISFLIWLEDRGPVFYLSERVGPDGKVFKIWKFRRLKKQFCTTSTSTKELEYEQKLIAQNDHRQDGILYKISNDPRSTKIGKFLEKTSLDEIPQFFNVILGNLSIVGPRPHQPREVARYQEDHYKVLNIKPGITGMAQISGRSDLKFSKEVELDCWYIENWSFMLDLIIILKTPITLFARHK
jgi:exopolysaccharide biosynthesis polyprenyl glycosylphosphotransferase